VSKHKAPAAKTKRIGVGATVIGVVIALLAGGAAAFFLGVPALLERSKVNQIKDSVTALAQEFDTASADRSPDTTVTGSFTGAGDLTLYDPETKANSKASLQVTDADYLLTFDGKLDSYTITVDDQTDDSDKVLIYDSVSKTIK
jgi:hypothetical protein